MSLYNTGDLKDLCIYKLSLCRCVKIVLLLSILTLSGKTILHSN